jgi:molecular chaperone GrpE
MSEDKKGRAGPGEGWEGFAEEDGGVLGPNPELEEAMREAAEAVEARKAVRRGEVTPDEPTERAPEPESFSEELAALKDRYIRLAADFENFRKRSLKEREEAYHFGHQNLVKDLLPSVDNLERAIEHARAGGEGGIEGLLEGVELVLREIHAVLAKHGVTPIDPLGQPFDPALHEAVAQVPDASQPSNSVVDVLERGYQLRGRLLRPTRVVVSKPPESERTDPKVRPDE